MTTEKKNIAIIGTGISGLTAAYYLQPHHNISVFEKDSRLGGHTATKDIEHNGKPYAIDTGFIVFNDWTYPNFIRLLDEINVSSQNTDMSFSVSCEKTGLEYAGSDLNTLFAQRKNILSPYFWRLIYDIIRFNKQAPKALDNGANNNTTLGEYLEANGYSEGFSNHYLIPMGAAIWSCSSQDMLDFPLAFFIRFFKNHGLLNIFNRPQWKTIKGGSKQYIKPLTQSFKDNIHLNTEITSIKRANQKVEITFASGDIQTFDEVIFACHSDQALALLNDPSDNESKLLSAISYRDNDVILHTDTRLLPKRELAWSSWNYGMKSLKQNKPTLTYDMNILQNISSETTFCVSLNCRQDIDPSTIIGEYSYAHPQFSIAACEAQQQWATINGVQQTWFCGAYWHNGFHEDGVASALRVVNQLLDESQRIEILGEHGALQ